MPRRNTSRGIWKVIASLLLAHIAAVPRTSWAQGEASINGAVTDTTGAIIAGAVVNVKNVEIGAVREIVTNPRHPYTRGLMDSIPRVGGRRDRLRQVDGTMPRLNEIPPGCPFNPRCPEVLDRCRQQRPDLLPAAGTDAACWLYDRALVPAEKVAGG